MTFETLLVARRGRLVTVTLHRPQRQNAINGAMLHDLGALLDDAERDPDVRCVVLEGAGGVFCTGLDLVEMLDGDSGPGAGPGSVTGDAPPASVETGAQRYFQMLKRFTLSPKLIVCRIDGRVEAGGVGFVAASDYAVASERSTFRLSEALIGLLPATLLPFLIRRVGPRAAYRLTLTAQALGAAEAERIGLLDGAGGDLDQALRRFLLAAERVPLRTVQAAKEYFEALSPISEATGHLATGRITTLLQDEANVARIRELMRQGVWQGGAHPAAPAAPAGLGE